MLAQVGELALARAKAWVRIGFVPTERNEPARKFLEAHGLLPAGGDGWQAFPAQRVAAVAFLHRLAVGAASRATALSLLVRTAVGKNCRNAHTQTRTSRR